MNLVETLRKKIVTLGDGEYVAGLRAVLQHIETAFRHLSRGQTSGDDSAFTDAIYRTNQAFEGSIKEAYRVLTGHDPVKKRAFDIESYLEKNKIFRSRVLTQLTTYRTEWRNPSTHDYKLDFDESEAFLAIISVSALACLLIDQIIERLAYVKSRAEADALNLGASVRVEDANLVDLFAKVLQLTREFCRFHLPSAGASLKHSEVQIVGALHGFLASAAPDIDVQIDVPIRIGDSVLRPDVILTRGKESVIVELKRTVSNENHGRALAQVQRYLRATGIKNGILLFFPEDLSEMRLMDSDPSVVDERIVIMRPECS